LIRLLEEAGLKAEKLSILDRENGKESNILTIAKKAPIT